MDTLKKSVAPWRLHAKQIVDEYVSRRTGLTIDEIHATRRTKDHIEARALAYLVLRSKYKMHLTTIGELYDKDHTTIIAGLRRAKKSRFFLSLNFDEFPELSPC